MERITEQNEKKKLCEKIDTVKEELDALKELLEKEEDFFHMLNLREVDAGTRMEWMRDIFDGAIQDETLALLCVLMERQELYGFSQVLGEGLKLLGVERQGVRGVVYSAVPLEEATVKKLEKQTANLLKKPVTLVNQIDESLIGGFLISADGKLIDASIRKRLEDLNVRLRSGVKGGEPL